MVRSATGEDEILDPSNASKSSSYLELAGDVGIILGDAPRGGEDCILLESMFSGQYCCVLSYVVIFSSGIAGGTAVLNGKIDMRARIAAS